MISKIINRLGVAKKTRSGQTVLEYLILVAFLIAVTALSISAFVTKAKSTSESLFLNAAGRISK